MMKISYKKFGAFAATAVLAGILAGCGSGMNADANDMARGDAAGKGSRPHTEFYGCKGCGFHADRCKWKGTQTFRLQGEKGVYQVLGFLVFCMYGYAG